MAVGVRGVPLSWKGKERKRDRASFLWVVTATIPMRATHKVPIRQATPCQEHFAHRFVRREKWMSHVGPWQAGPGPWQGLRDGEQRLKPVPSYYKWNFLLTDWSFSILLPYSLPQKSGEFEIFWRIEGEGWERGGCLVCVCVGVYVGWCFQSTRPFLFPWHRAICDPNFKVAWFSGSSPGMTVFVMIWLQLFFFSEVASSVELIYVISSITSGLRGRPDEFTLALKWDLSKVNSYQKLILIFFFL